jgi:MASE11
MKGKAVFGSFWPPPSMSQPTDLQSWRTWLLTVMIYFAVIVFPFSMLVTFPVFIQEKMYAMIALVVWSYLLIILQLVLRGRYYKGRGYVWIILIYLMTISFHVALGPHYARPAWLILTAITAAFIFGTRAAAAAVVLNIAILLTLYWAMGDSVGPWTSVYSESFGKWIMYVVNISLITLVCALPVGFLLNRLDISLKHERKSLWNLS